MPGGMSTIILYGLSLFVLNALGISIFCKWARCFGLLLDAPNMRSTHRATTCRGAGIIFVWSAVLSWGLIEYCSHQPLLLPLICGGVLVALVSFMDDLHDISIRARLCIQIIAATVFVSQVALPDLVEDSLGIYAVLWRIPAVFFIVAVTNIYNFMDGLDGLTASHTCLVLAGWIAFGSLFSLPVSEMLVCVALLVPLLGFLSANWHPASVFMGDVGSTFIGFTLSCVALMQIGDLPRLINFFAILMLMMPFLFDATFTIVSRYLRGEDWYRPHRLHIFQRIYDQGVSQPKIVLVYIALTVYMGAMLLLTRLGVLSDITPGAVLFMAPYPMLYCWLWYLELDTGVNAGAEQMSL